MGFMEEDIANIERSRQVKAFKGFQKAREDRAKKTKDPRTTERRKRQHEEILAASKGEEGVFLL